MKHFQKTIAVALAVIAATAVATARADVKTKKDPNFNFTTLKTFAWKTPPGEVKILVSKDSQAKAEPTRQKYEPVLMQTVETELVKLGYAPAAAGTKPDFDLIYYVLILNNSTSQHMGQFLPTNATWGLPLFSPQTTSFEIYAEGSIVLDAYAPSGSQMVWRGIVQAKIKEVITDAERAKRVQSFTKELTQKFPKRK